MSYRGVRGSAYPHKFQTSLRIPDYVAKYEDLEPGTQLNEEQISLAGSHPEALLSLCIGWIY